MRTIGEGLEQAGSEFEDAYDDLLDSVESHGQLSETAEDYFEEAHDYISEELAEFQTGVLMASSDISEAEEVEDAEGTTEELQEAGQSLANAYRAANMLWNKAEGVIHNGDHSLESDISRIGTGVDTGAYNDSLNRKEDAFEMYQEVLDDASGEVAEFYREHGMTSNMDFGLEHQQPEEPSF